MCEHTNPTLVDPPVEIVSRDESSSTSGPEVINHEVRFGIPLQDQRRIWILENLLNEGVHSVLDIGCGEGDLMSCLCNPAPYLPDPPPPTPSTSSLPQPSTLTHAAEPDPEKFIHVHTLQGLDISRECLEWTIRSTAPPPPSLPASPSPSPPPSIHVSPDSDPKASSQQNHLSEQEHTVFSPDGSHDLTHKRKRRKERDWSWRPRWEELEVKIWEGGLQTTNEEFVGVECIVATEVIEHLPPSIFPSFAPVLLGKYHPRLLLMTTPNYSFNELFRPPLPPLPPPSPSLSSTTTTTTTTTTGAGDTWGYADPTNRTTRRFRHDDHKFEWTPRECREWAVAVGAEWGYEVSVGGVGRANERDPWGRDRCADGDGGEDADKVWGTQVVRFRRMDGEASGDEGEGKYWERKRKERYEQWRVSNATETEFEQDIKEHELLATHHYAKHPRSGKPSSLAEVADIVREHMREAGIKEMSIHSLWMEEEVAEACGGWIEVLLEAVHKSREVFEVRKGDDDEGVNRREDVDRGRVVRREDWIVILLEDLPTRDKIDRQEEGDSEEELEDEDEEADERQSDREYSGSNVVWGGGEDSEETTVVGDATADSVWGWGTSEGGWDGEGGGWGDGKGWGDAEVRSSVDPLQDN